MFGFDAGELNERILELAADGYRVGEISRILMEEGYEHPSGDSFIGSDFVSTRLHQIKKNRRSAGGMGVRDGV